MTRGVKTRLLAFLVLSAVGIVYIAANYLGIVDKITGRGLTLHADLPTSGGLFVGSEVTYRGVKVGKVSDMDVTRSGVRLTLAVEEDTRIPVGSPFYVHNLSAVGEQYIDFEPAGRAGPYAEEGATFTGNQASLPQATDDLLMKLDGLVSSLNQADVATVTSELGTMFTGTASPLRKMVDSGAKLVADAKANEAATVELIRSGQTVLETQQANSANIQSFAADLADLTQTLRNSDKNLRILLAGGIPAVNEVNALLNGLAPTLPSFLGNLGTVNQVMTERLNALEQTLVTLPRVISSGFTGTPGDGFGHINLQLDYAVPPCTKGYLPPGRWRPATDLSDTPTFPARCLSGPPVNMRGSKYAPAPSGVTGTRNRVAPYDAGVAPGVGSLGSGRQNVFGMQSWQSQLLGTAE